MDEKKYIETTNLCKLRIAKIILDDCYHDKTCEIGINEYISVMKKIQSWIAELEEHQNNY